MLMPSATPTEKPLRSNLIPGLLKTRPSELLLGKTAIGLARFGVALALLLPPGAKDLPLCMLRSQTGIPCLGCGMTRSLSHAFRGDLAASWTYHPFGPIIAVVLVMIVAVSLLPGTWRETVKKSLDRFPAVVNGLCFTFLGSFVLFGLWRAVHYVLTH